MNYLFQTRKTFILLVYYFHVSFRCSRPCLTPINHELANTGTVRVICCIWIVSCVLLQIVRHYLLNFLFSQKHVFSPKVFQQNLLCLFFICFSYWKSKLYFSTRNEKQQTTFTFTASKIYFWVYYIQNYILVQLAALGLSRISVSFCSFHLYMYHFCFYWTF